MFDPLPLISSRAALGNMIREAAGEQDRISLLCLPTANDAIDYLAMELPLLAIIDLSDDSLNAWEVLEFVSADPWLLHGGIIAVTDQVDTARRAAALPNGNLITVINTRSLTRDLPRVLQTVDDNKRLLYQRSLGAGMVGNIGASFDLDNDPVLARCYASLVCNFLFNTGRFSLDVKNLLQVGLYELLMNAIEHGNCALTSADKTAWLDQGKSIEDLIAQRQSDPVIASRRVHFEYALMPDRASFCIRDEGAGFDWRAQDDGQASDEVMALSGRGLAMARAISDELRFNETGNEVRLEVRYFNGGEDLTPYAFKSLPVQEVESGQRIFTEGERSDHLYYIVEGQFSVEVGGQLVSEVGPEDIFMGEMSFLLRGRRTATVTARSPGRLITVSRRDFVIGLRENPHYGLFMAKLLAQRIDRANQRGVPIAPMGR